MPIKSFEVATKKREQIVDITKQVERVVRDSGIKQGLCFVFVPHATAAVIINENYDAAVCDDILSFLKQQIPQGVWKHDAIDNNADSHIKSSLLGVSQVIPIEDGKLMLGTWQGIGLVELDGPRKRNVIVVITKI